MMPLVRLRDSGTPTEYLLARICGRRRQLLRDPQRLIGNREALERSLREREGIPPLLDPDAGWTLFHREIRRIYSWMNVRFREDFQTYFLYIELKRLFIILRLLLKGAVSDRSDLGEESLLDPVFLEKIVVSANQSEAIVVVESRFARISDLFRGLSAVHAREGPRGFEKALVNRFLQYAVHGDIPEVLREFFALIIDARNLLTLYKMIKFKTHSDEDFIRGGNISYGILRGMARTGDDQRLIDRIARFSGKRVEIGDIGAVENALHSGISRFLNLRGRDPGDPAALLDYLWRYSLEARKIGLLLVSREQDRDIFSRELGS